jgi:hypothetical protein
MKFLCLPINITDPFKCCQMSWMMNLLEVRFVMLLHLKDTNLNI